MTGQVDPAPAVLRHRGRHRAGAEEHGRQLAPAGRPAAALGGRPADLRPAGRRPGDLGGDRGQGSACRRLTQRCRASSILAGFGQQGFLQVSSRTAAPRCSARPRMAVVVIPGTVPSAKVSSAVQPGAGLAHPGPAGGGPGRAARRALLRVGTGSAIDAVSSGGAGVALTTVDNADTATGQIIVVQALHELLGPHATPASLRRPAWRRAQPGTKPRPVARRLEPEQVTPRRRST